MQNLFKLTFLTIFSFNLIQAAENNRQKNNLGKRFIASFSQGMIYAPITPAVLGAGIILSPLIVAGTCSELDQWGKGNRPPKRVLRSTSDKAQMVGQITGYLTTGFFILKRFLK